MHSQGEIAAVILFNRFDSISYCILFTFKTRRHISHVVLENVTSLIFEDQNVSLEYLEIFFTPN